MTVLTILSFKIVLILNLIHSLSFGLKEHLGSFVFGLEVVDYLNMNLLLVDAKARFVCNVIQHVDVVFALIYLTTYFLFFYT